MIKLKKLLKESKYAWDRKFGDPLPTFKDIAETHQNKPKEQIIESIDLQSHFIELRVMQPCLIVTQTQEEVARLIQIVQNTKMIDGTMIVKC